MTAACVIYEKTCLTFHAGETWRIDFTCHESDGAVMPLPPGSTARFRMADNSGVLPLDDIFTRDTTNDIVITDGPNGKGTITIQPGTQSLYNIVAGGDYLWEFRVETLSFASVQGNGKFKVLPSLFTLGP